MDTYDADEPGMQFFSVLEEDGKFVGNDPYLKDVDVDSESEDDCGIRESDLVLVAATAEEDTCSLEMYVYAREDNSLWVHHDILLSAYPLCTSTVLLDGQCFIAVGSFDSAIELWDPHVEDVMEPTLCLGLDKKAQKKAKNPGRGSHTGAVLAVDACPVQANVLASGGADGTVRLWDAAAGKHASVFQHHSDKVQSCKWHPTEPGALLTASFDRSVCALDVRQDAAPVRGALPADAEAVCWTRHAPFGAVVSCEDGSVVAFDVRKLSTPRWTLSAHSGACTAVRDTAQQGMLVTTGTDASCKVWKDEGAGPALVFERDLKAGPLFSCTPNEDEPHILCCTGNCVVIWDITDTDAIVEAFALS